MKNLELFSIKNKNVVITGAGRGLGFQISEFYQNNGANVFAFDKIFKKKFASKKIKKIKCDFFNKKKNHRLDWQITKTI